MGEQLEGSLVAPALTWCGGSRGPRMAHEAGNSVPVWLATRSRFVTCYTGIAATGARLLDLHRGFIHHASRTTQPPRGGATAASACVAARAEDELNRIVPAGRSACVGGGRLIRLLVVGCLKCVAERGCGAGLGIECAAVLMF
jgi:hypothetical protein